MAELAVLADDATGAAAVAAEVARWGLSVAVCRSVPQRIEHAVIVIDLDARDRHDHVVGPLAAAMAGSLRAAGAQRLFVKIDSLLRGPVAAVLGGATAGFAAEPGICCPAFPAAGRLVHDGQLTAGDQRIGIRAHLPAGWCTRDCSTAANLEAMMAGWPASQVYAGSYGPLGAWARQQVVGQRPVLAVIGSATARSRRQIDHAHEHGVAVVERVQELARVLASESAAVLCLPSAGGDVTTIDSGLLHALVTPVAQLLADQTIGGLIGGLICSGGGTARQVWEACGITSCTPTGWEPMPSVPLLRAVDGPVPGLPIIVKSGSVGEDDALLELVRSLTGCAP